MGVGGGEGGGGRGTPHVKLTVPLVELASQAVQSTLAILEELTAESSEEVQVCPCSCTCTVYIYVALRSLRPVQLQR